MLKNYLKIKPAVAAALNKGKAVLALESTIISHGMPYPQNVETALKVEKIAKDHGAEPATIAIIDGYLKIGLTEEEIDFLGKKGEDVAKCSRRDIPIILNRKIPGATTVASTMILAGLAGIKIFATGGIGGVHRGAEKSFDISADLEELTKTNVAVICAGAKSILDIGLTLEYLETRGVPVLGYQTNQMPAFYTRESGFKVDYQMDSAAEIAELLKTKWDLGLQGGAVIANPIPKEDEANPMLIKNAISEAITEMDQKGIKGKETTPFLLAKIAELTKGDSLDSNIKLVFNNVKIGAEIAVQLSQQYQNKG
ncbi:MAG: pseudouridine-5'-phosphate glycosidase [Spirochaetes bacterium]|nr:pseudouridine-5'-phosphate glycosidase [Spirochaetota bacterium]